MKVSFSHASRLVLTIVAVVLLALAAARAGKAQSQVVVLAPDADGYVDSEKPDQRYGFSTILRTETPEQHSYLRFQVAASGGAILRATLRLYANGGSSGGYQVFAVADNSWSEAELSYRVAPALGALLGASGPHAGGSYTEVDLTGYVTGPGSFTVAVVSAADRPVSYSSREAGANGPQLVLEVAAAATVAPASTASPTETAPIPPSDTPPPTLPAEASATNSPDPAPPSDTPPAAEGATLVFAPAADTYVDAASPSSNRGRSTVVRTRAQPSQITFLQFQVQGLGGAAVQGATLRLYANGRSAAGVVAYAVAPGTWDEASLTFANQPALGSQVGASGPHAGARYVEVDLAGFVQGEGPVSLALVTEGDKAVSYPSREAGVNGPQLVVALSQDPGGPPVPTATETTVPATATPTPSATRTASPSATATLTRTPTPTATATRTPTATFTPAPTHTPVASATADTGRDPTGCNLNNGAWSDPGRLLRGARPAQGSLSCLARFGVDVIIDITEPFEASYNEAREAQQAGIEYINLGVPDDTAPSPDTLRLWLNTVETYLAQGDMVLVHDAAGRGRMGLWDAVYFLVHRNAAAVRAIEDRYLGKTLPFTGAKIGCDDGGNGQVQALAEIAAIVTGTTYYPQIDEYGTRWQNCARPSYMSGWDYSIILTD